MDKGTTRHASARRGGGRLQRLSRPAVVGLALSLVLIAVGGILAYADVIGSPNSGGLTQVGPTSGENGFPAWYKDKNNVRLEPCIDANDANCAAGAPLPDPSKPMSFPDNFPDEMFYQLADSAILPADLSAADAAAHPGFKAVSSFNLEGAFGGGVPKAKDQIVFGRVRFFYKGLVPGAKYRITHPYGVDEETADDSGAIRFTEDGGLSIGQFGEALNSRIGPFLQWDTGAPAGYLGDGATEHNITGSPYATNFVHIQGIAGAKAGDPVDSLDVTKTQFTVMGKKATTSGVGVDRVTYSRTTATDGTLDVFANTQDDAAPSIEVTGTGFDPTPLRGEAGRYVARVPFTGSTPPSTVNVTNVSDVPVSKKVADVTDAVQITNASYDADLQTLTVNANSSDKLAPPTLTATGYGDLDSSGVLVVNNIAGAPANVTVKSTAGGSATVPVTMTGKGFAPTPAVAFAGTDQRGRAGQDRHARRGRLDRADHRLPLDADGRPDGHPDRREREDHDVHGTDRDRRHDADVLAVGRRPRHPGPQHGRHHGARQRARRGGLERRARSDGGRPGQQDHARRHEVDRRDRLRLEADRRPERHPDGCQYGQPDVHDAQGLRQADVRADGVQRERRGRHA